MPNWLCEEVAQASRLAREIEQLTCPRRRNFSGPVLRLTLSEAVPLLNDLAGNRRALPIRQLFQVFGFDEHRQLRWRLEHKLVQALVLMHYCSKAIPVTHGFSRYRGVHRNHLRRSLHDAFPDGFYIKAALSDSTGEQEICDRTHLILAAIESGQQRSRECTNISEEELIVQERIQMLKEYRVHSIEDQVIEDCTFRRYGRGNIRGERDAPNDYIRAILARLPDGLVAGSLYGWDIGLTTNHEFRIIEANPSGIHPVYKPGFHCSGFYHDKEWGANVTARLLRFIEHTDRVTVMVDPDTKEHADLCTFYSAIVCWLERLKTEP